MYSLGHAAWDERKGPEHQDQDDKGDDTSSGQVVTPAVRHCVSTRCAIDLRPSAPFLYAKTNG